MGRDDHIDAKPGWVSRRDYIEDKAECDRMNRERDREYARALVRVALQKVERGLVWAERRPHMVTASVDIEALRTLVNFARHALED